ncbi:glycosyltransferase [Fusobacterium necrophorum]|uniref:glycosyltransferase n=1 Tax=Fusobacterium necrophorum TaxID=859 RepID=UPI00370E5C77
MKKRILFRSGSLGMGGLEKVLVQTLQILSSSEWDISLLLTYDEKEKNILEKEIPKNISYSFLNDNNFLKKMEYSQLRKKQSLYHKLKYLYFLYKARKNSLQKTKEYIKKYGPFDIFIDYDGGAMKYIEQISIPEKVVFFHSSPSQAIHNKGKQKRYQKRLQKYTKIIAICDAMKEELREMFPSLSDKIFRIYNPFLFKQINSLQYDTSSLSENEKKLLSDDYCLMVSRLDTNQKDFDTLFHAFYKAKKEGLQDKLYLIGEGVAEKELKEKVHTLGLEKEILFLGLQKNPYPWMTHSKLLVHSSRAEGFGLVLVEALACGRMVITSDCPVGPREILNHESCGVLFSVGNIEQLKNQLLLFLQNSELRKKYESHISESISRFDSKAILQAYQKLFL